MGPRHGELAALADRQHGVVALGQLRALGLSERAVQQRARESALHRVYRGVYAVGRRGLSGHGFWMAAVLAYGPEAALSHRSAAALLGLRPDNRGSIDVSVPRVSANPRPGIDVHATTTLRPEDVAGHQGIPSTTVARTLLDLGDVEGRRAVERAVEQAEVLRIFDGRAVELALERANGRRGAAVLRSVVGDWADAGLTASELEERFRELCRKAGHPLPAVNAWVSVPGEEIQVDFLWRAKRLIVETDGRGAHGTRRAFEEDRRRDQVLQVAGYRVVRFTWRQVAREPEHVADTIGALL